MIYTRKGDKGMTSMFEPDATKRNRVSKASKRVAAIGAIDETNSYLGVANIYTKSPETKKRIKHIQKNLFTIGALISQAPLTLEPSATAELEEAIDAIEENLPPIRNFLMPEGSVAAVHFMYARSIARRAERQLVALSRVEEIPLDVLSYINRLSDYLFCIFRDENARSGEREELWIGKKS